MEMEIEKEICPIYEEFLGWFKAEVMPGVDKWLKHIANCPVCQEKMLEGKDAFGLGILLTSEEQFKQALDKYQE